MKRRYDEKNNPMYGKHHSEESKQKNRIAHLGRKQSPEHIAKRIQTFKRIGFFEIMGKIRKGSHHTKETKQKLRLANLGKKQSPEHIAKRVLKLRGKRVSEETKRKISESEKGKKLSEETKLKIKLNNASWNRGLKGYSKGRKVSMETRKKISESQKGKIISEETKQKQREARARQVFPLKDTSIEVKLQQALKQENIIFETHKPILGQPDIFIAPNICIFADGCYWHGCEQCLDKNKSNQYQQKKQISDLYITLKLKSYGYVVLRFWEHTINADVSVCIEEIKKTLMLPLETHSI